MSASVEASWNGFGASVAGSASFSEQMTAKHGVASQRTRAFAYGMDKNFILNPDINALGKIVDDFHTHSNTGAGISLVM